MSFDPWKDWSVRVVRLQGGQPRPYADSIYEAELHYSFPGENGQGRPSKETVSKHARGLVRYFPPNPECWADARLVACEEIRPLVWRVKIVEPYTD